MTRQQKAHIKYATLGVFAAGCLFAGYLSSSPLGVEVTVQPGDSAAPTFKIIERNMILDTAILSVETRNLRTNDIRRIARYLTENHVQNSRDAASIYFYKPESNLAKDEPVHKIAWTRRTGYELEY